jgi:phosphoenolpyruvate carboxykinase (GTP)
VGLVPVEGGIDTNGLDVAPDDMAELLRVDVEEWRAEVPSIEEHYANLGERLPVELRDELNALEKRLSSK